MRKQTVSIAQKHRPPVFSLHLKGGRTMKDEIKIQLQPVQTKRASEEIYEQIRQLILDGKILPGERLPSERNMMEMMHRSRPTIREAMRMLERDGYIKIYSGSSGAVVQELSVDNAVQSLETIMHFQHLTMDNLLEFRRMTESVAAELAAQKRTDEDLRKLENILANTELAIGDADKFIHCDLQFHLAVADASKNAMYSIMLQVCRDIIGESLTEVLAKGDRTEQLERYPRILEAHRAVYQAIAAGQPEKAFPAMKRHLMDAEKDILEK